MTLNDDKAYHLHMVALDLWNDSRAGHLFKTFLLLLII